MKNEASSPSQSQECSHLNQNSLVQSGWLIKIENIGDLKCTAVPEINHLIQNGGVQVIEDRSPEKFNSITFKDSERNRKIQNEVGTLSRYEKFRLLRK